MKGFSKAFGILPFSMKFEMETYKRSSIVARRAAARDTWMRLSTDNIAVRFVLRCGNLSDTARKELEGPYNDVVCINTISAEEGRLRGPILALAWWLEHAPILFPPIQFVCKADADRDPGEGVARFVDRGADEPDQDLDGFVLGR